MGSRVSHNEFVYGWHAVSALLQRHPERILRISVAKGRDDARWESLRATAAAAGRSIERVEPKVLDKLAGDVAHQGIVAEVRGQSMWGEDELHRLLNERAARESAEGGKVSPPLLLALDGVQDPHNLGACLRSADACGALAVIIPKDRAVPLNATVRKVAAGAAETTPVVAVTNFARCLRELKEHGLWVVGADAAADRPVAEVDLCGPTVLVLGAEGAGLRQLTRQHCDLLASLPSLGAVESLNVSVAAGMMLYEALRQRRTPR
jgi:23S rRNA (guanosine2251-2'-O)-methyltransferase